MVRIRLKRGGKKFSAYYKIVVADARSPRDGKFIEEVGNYNPISKEYTLSHERILYWLSVGAQPSDMVRTLMKRDSLWEKFARMRTQKKTKG